MTPYHRFTWVFTPVPVQKAVQIAGLVLILEFFYFLPLFFGPEDQSREQERRIASVFRL